MKAVLLSELPVGSLFICCTPVPDFRFFYRVDYRFFDGDVFCSYDDPVYGSLRYSTFSGSMVVLVND